MTGLEWVTALVRLNGLDDGAAEAAARAALDTVELLGAADKKIGAYSRACASASSWPRRWCTSRNC